MAAVVELAALFFLFFEGKKTPAFFCVQGGGCCVLWLCGFSGVYVGVCGVLFDELSPGSDVFAHEHGEYVVCCGCVFDGYLFE